MPALADPVCGSKVDPRTDEEERQVVNLMVQGCSSWAGKSLLSTALARIFSRRGLRVAPFKALNMSNNARVVEGGEIATAQYLQALAAGAQPDVRMNPVLVKPEGDTRSQVVVLGKVDPMLSRTAWRGRTNSLWPRIEEAFRSLESESDLLILEGAGSPAEFNLWDADVANMKMAELARAVVLLVADIDRGGAFAHLYGTWSLLPERQQSLIRGFVLNKFRGDPALLDPAPSQLERMTGVPVIGLIPYLHHGLPDEDGAAPVATAPRAEAETIAVIRYPTASNLDEFKLVEGIVQLRWAWEPSDLEDADLVVLPGSKHVASDLAWLRERGFAGAIEQRVRRGGRVLGICGGLQMLGQRIDDAAGVDGSANGLELLPLSTRFDAKKITRRGEARFASLPVPWSALSGLSFSGYEIRHGTSRPNGLVAEAIDGALGFVSGSVLAVYLHGMFESPTLLRAMFGVDRVATLHETFDQLADVVEAGVDMAALDRALGIGG
jgi:adenosylcobyric acid synthase